MSEIKLISTEQLANLILDESKLVGNDFVVIDVRDNSRAYGYIVNSINVFANIFEEDMTGLIEELKDVKQVIFHCNRSRSSGPKSAKLYQEALLSKLPESTQEVCVLEGGFAKFQLEYHANDKLVISHQNNFWEEFLKKNPL